MDYKCHNNNGLPNTKIVVLTLVNNTVDVLFARYETLHRNVPLASSERLENLKVSLRRYSLNSEKYKSENVKLCVDSLFLWTAID